MEGCIGFEIRLWGCKEGVLGAGRVDCFGCLGWECVSSASSVLEGPIVQDLPGGRHVEPDWGRMQVQEECFQCFTRVLGGAQHGLNGSNLSLSKAIRPWEVGGGSNVIYIIAL